MKVLPCAFLLLLGISWTGVQSTCVFETDFGLSINCGIKKSGLFRVRNLGGLKGYVGLGIQLADELGFKESLSSLEQNSKRRSVNGFAAPGSFEPLAVPQNNNRVPNAGAPTTGGQDRSAYAKMNGRSVGGGKSAATVPPFRPLMSAASNLVRNVRLSGQQQQQQQQQPLLKPLPVPAFAALPESIARVAVETPPPPVRPVAVVAVQRQPAPVVERQPVAAAAGRLSQQQQTAMLPTPLPPLAPSPQSQPQPLPSVYYQNAMQQAANSRFNAFAQIPQNPSNVRPIVVVQMDNQQRPKYAEKSPLSNEVDTGSMMSLFKVAAANNVSVEQLAMALRHQSLQHASPYHAANTPAPATATTTEVTTTTTARTTTAPPPPPPPPTTPAYLPTDEPPAAKKIAIRPYKSKYSTGHKVMNAPKEYYPVGYDKNFDDNFVSKVDLPDTSFSCGDQKHFPGLYGDEDLGCMVFHVCAFTDDGLTQKSFLCPESTLFDQTILKCNWWFYVDCKSSKKLYDSNIPVSKSYQLMKALTFFSSYSAGTTIDSSMAAAAAAIAPPPQTPSAPAAEPPRHAATEVTKYGGVDLSSNKYGGSEAPKYGNVETVYAIKSPDLGPQSSAATTTTTTTTTKEVLDNVSFNR